MTSRLSVSLIFGAACVLGLIVFALLGAGSVMHSYLAAWLVLLALPAGALPLAMALELMPVETLGVLPALRRLLWLMPVAALLAIPVLIAFRSLFPALDHDAPGFPGLWNRTSFFVARSVVILAVWTVLALIFARPNGRPRAALAGIGLALHLVFVTIAAQDWILALEPGFVSSAGGLLLMAGQCGLAIAAAALITARRVEPFPPGIATTLAAATAAWLFLTFTQYLVAWSANLPAEAAWYGHRASLVGFAAEVVAGLVCFVALLTLLNDVAAHSARLVGAAALLLLVLHGGGMLWVVTPAARGHFSITLADLLALGGLLGLGVGLSRFIVPEPAEAARG